MTVSRICLGLAGRAALAALLYLGFASKLEWPELCMAVIAGALAAAAIYQLRRNDGQRVEFIVPPLGWFVRLAIMLVSDSAKVIAALLGSVVGHTVTGRLQTMPFDAGDGDGRSAARRTWVTLGKSLPPNSIVIFIDRFHQRLLLHELVFSQRESISQEWPT